MVDKECKNTVEKKCEVQYETTYETVYDTVCEDVIGKEIWNIMPIKNMAIGVISKVDCSWPKQPKNRHFLEQMHSTIDKTHMNLASTGSGSFPN